MKHFYERNDSFLNSDVNKTFEEILWMSKSEFKDWLHQLRETVVRVWDEEGNPPRVGLSEDKIIEQFNKLESFPLDKLEAVDEMTGENDVIRNTRLEGNAVNQWFPTMMKTRINYNGKDKAKSIYDWFAKPELFKSQLTYSYRHFKRDSFYDFSSAVRNGDDTSLFDAENGVEWIKKFEAEQRQYGTHDYWLEPKEKIDEYTGYNDDLRGSTFHYITKEELEELNDLIPEKCKTNLWYKADEYDKYRIRVFKYGQKLFPTAFKAFRVSYCQYAVNFPPLTAKYIYQTFTEEFKDRDVIKIWDPSAGWAGRLLGAMSVKSDRQIHYIGTDPNTDHNIENGKTKYDDIAEFYNTRTTIGNNISFMFDEDEIIKANTWEIHQCGSEVFGQTEAFKKHVGTVSLVFTSPPYFAKEIYSEDPAQSCHKFTQYNSWRDDFLRPTLENAYKLLHEGGYLIWNIADATFNGTMLPLEKDSCDIMEDLGLKYVKTLKMALAQMPGGNRVDPKTGKPTAKNFCKVNGVWLKYEPIFVFKKC